MCQSTAGTRYHIPDSYTRREAGLNLLKYCSEGDNVRRIRSAAEIPPLQTLQRSRTHPRTQGHKLKHFSAKQRPVL